jgi:hypothetical protein
MENPRRILSFMVHEGLRLARSAFAISSSRDYHFLHGLEGLLSLLYAQPGTQLTWV